MHSVLRYSMQALAYALFAASIGWLATNPIYEYADPESASFKISLSHAADRVAPCVPLTQEEIAALAANMRQAEACERERLPVVLELDIDGQAALRINAPATGLWNDGPASIYQRLELPAGSHRFSVRLRDTARSDGWDYSFESEANFAAGRNYTLTFRGENGGFRFR